MNLNNITLKTQEALQSAQQIALENDHQSIEVGHLLKGIFEVDENVTPYIFKKLSTNLPVVKQALNSILDSYPKQKGGGQYLSRPANEAVQKS